MATKKQASSPSAAQIVWQWVCYGLWEWTLIALSILLSSALAYFFVAKDADYQFTIYVLATVICLLPLAFVVDRVYAKQEPEQKHGFAGVVMVLNAVLVFLTTIGAFITAVISTLMLAIDVASDGKVITIISSLVVATLGMLLFIRIINPPKLRKLNSVFGWIVTGITVATLVLSFAGPFRNLVATRDDRLIEDNLYVISNEINNYANDHRELPANLQALQLSYDYQDGAKQLIDRGVVRYTPNTTPSTGEPTDSAAGEQLTDTLHYKLCVTYEHAKGNGKNRTEMYDAQSNHSAGDVCYEQEALVYKSQ